MSLQETIKSEIKVAMMAKDAVKLTVIRGLVSGFTNELVSLGRTPQSELSDEEVALFFDQLMDLVAAAYILHQANRASPNQQEGNDHE